MTSRPPDDTDLTETDIDRMTATGTPVEIMTERPTEHAYLSTGCLHGEHAYCQSGTGASGAKSPAQCKFCAAPCRCSCHLVAGDTGEPHSAAYLRLKAAGEKAMGEAKLHALHGMKRVYQLARRYGDAPIPAAEVLGALGLDKDANTVESLVKHRAARGDEVEAWLKAQRGLYMKDSAGWQTVDDLLDVYRLHADTGRTLDEHVCESRMVGECGHPEGRS